MVLKTVTTLYLLFDLRFIKCELLEALDPEFHDINDMFPSFTQTLDPTVLQSPADVIVRNISVDLEKIDIVKYRRKLDKYRNRLGDFDGDVANWTDRLNESRRMKFYGHDWWRNEWGRAQNHIVKTKCLDMALQIIYMARHKIKQLESMPYFNRHDTSYRIAFLYRRLRKLWKKMNDMLTTMKRKKHYWGGPFARLPTYFRYHQKVVILHVDFVYMWWVLVNLHDKYKMAHFIPNTLPPYLTST